MNEQLTSQAYSQVHLDSCNLCGLPIIIMSIPMVFSSFIFSRCLVSLSCTKSACPTEHTYFEYNKMTQAKRVLTRVVKRQTSLVPDCIQLQYSLFGSVSPHPDSLGRLQHRSWRSIYLSWPSTSRPACRDTLKPLPTWSCHDLYFRFTSALPSTLHKASRTKKYVELAWKGAWSSLGHFPWSSYDTRTSL